VLGDDLMAKSYQFSLLSPLDVRRSLDTIMTDAPADIWGRYDADTCELVLAEALNNIVEHGQVPPEAPVLVNWAEHEVLQITITDRGRPCPQSVIDGATLPDPDDMPEGGFGWAMIRMLCQDLTYRHERGQNTLGFSIQPRD